KPSATNAATGAKTGLTWPRPCRAIAHAVPAARLARRTGTSARRTRARPWRTRARSRTRRTSARPERRAATPAPSTEAGRGDVMPVRPSADAGAGTGEHARLLTLRRDAAGHRAARPRPVDRHPLGRDDDLLRRGDLAAVAVDRERRGRVDVALEHGERDRPELVVARDRRHVPDGALAVAHLGARDGQHVARAVQVQHREAARRAAQVVHARDRLLTAVAALVQVHRGAQPVELVRDAPVV